MPEYNTIPELLLDVPWQQHHLNFLAGIKEKKLGKEKRGGQKRKRPSHPILSVTR